MQKRLGDERNCVDFLSFCNLDKYIWQFKLIHQQVCLCEWETEEIVSINMSCNIILQTKYLSNWTNEFGNLDKYTSTFVYSCSIWLILVYQIFCLVSGPNLVSMNPTTRILQDQSFFSFSVTLRVPPSISGTESRIIKPPVAKRPAKKYLK